MDGGSQRYIFAPFVQSDALWQLLRDAPNRRGMLVTRWNPEDLLSGVSDIEVYDTCLRLGMSMLLHRKLHMKVYSWDLETAVIGSANVTAPGLGINEEANVEFMTGPSQLSAQEQLYLRQTISEALLVTPGVYKSAAEWLDGHPSHPRLTASEQEATWLSASPSKSMLVSALPMSESPRALKEGLAALRAGRFEGLPGNLRACVLHDLINFDLTRVPDGEFDRELRKRFFSHPFVLRVLERITPCAFFGEMKEWIQKSCQDVPIPSRRDLTGNVQVLLAWLVDLGEGRFVIDVPGAHSQRICRQGSVATGGIGPKKDSVPQRHEITRGALGGG